METEELEEVERHCRKATSGVKKGSSQQTASQLGVNSEDEKAEGADHVTQDSESQTHYIAIQRNSKYYQSMRLRSRQKERNNREGMNARHAVGEYQTQKSLLFLFPLQLREGAGRVGRELLADQH